ncbi:MAG TPA: 2-succinyl-6-hydroxy-2,4-cyclohexadiene-1-carboxylate synthase [Candidatus Hydrogenedentes bacterium]|nr:2-succinyl-6-hydroxy-2,4-cyclohexadiene-1-carboxylate synthase [Candidatus Hydrogenedentota bacterium]
MARTLHYWMLNPAGEKTVVFLHGFMGSSEDWRPIAQGLPPNYRCIAPDLPGHGRTPVRRDEAAYTMAAVSKDLMRLMDHIAPGPLALVGYSMGGRLALYLALEYADRVQALVLESASPGLRSETERAKRRVEDERRAVELESGDWEAFLRRWYAAPLFESLHGCGDRFEELLMRRRNNNPRELARVLRGMGTGAQSSLWDRLSEAGMPTLLIAGERDAKYCAMAAAMGAKMPRATAMVVSGAGHNVHFEKPGDYTTRLRKWLDGLRGTPAH